MLGLTALNADLKRLGPPFQLLGLMLNTSLRFRALDASIALLNMGLALLNVGLALLREDVGLRSFTFGVTTRP